MKYPLETSFREEKKYIPYNFLSLVEIRNYMLLNGFRETSQYYVYSVYFDLDNYINAIHHLEGNFRRRKQRIRFYLNKESQLVNGFFWEEKIKEGNLGSKYRTRIPQSENFLGKYITSDFDLHTLIRELLSLTHNIDVVSGKSKALRPVVLVKYHRTRFSSLSEEANLDEEISFSSLNNRRVGHFFTFGARVLEFKIPFRTHNSRLCSLSSQLPLPRTSFSKYLYALNKLGILRDY